MKLKFNRIEDLTARDGKKIRVWFDVLDDEGVKQQEYAYLMPEDIFEWRVLEYGELTEDELVEIVVAEAAMALGMGSVGEGLTTLEDAPSQETARKDHITRCVRTKLLYRISTQSGPVKLRDALKSKIKFNENSMREKRRRLKDLLPPQIESKGKKP